MLGFILLAWKLPLLVILAGTLPIYFGALYLLKGFSKETMQEITRLS